MTTEIQRSEFIELVKPLIKWINNYHPHHHIVIDHLSAELSEGVIDFGTEEYLKD